MNTTSNPVVGTSNISELNQVVRTGTGSVERTGTGSVKRTGWLMLALFALLVSSGSALAASSYSIGSFLVTASDDQVAVSWHRLHGSSIQTLTGTAKLENGYALIDLAEVDLSGKSGDFSWGQVEVQLLETGISGAITPYGLKSSYQFESSSSATYLMPFEQAGRPKHNGGGTGD